MHGRLLSSYSPTSLIRVVLRCGTNAIPRFTNNAGKLREQSARGEERSVDRSEPGATVGVVGESK